MSKMRQLQDYEYIHSFVVVCGLTLMRLISDFWADSAAETGPDAGECKLKVADVLVK